jgi:hypothetical protein
MSSSRSVAAARARRAGETSVQRPRSSIGSYSQIPQYPPAVPTKFPAATAPYGPRGGGQQQPQQPQQQQQLQQAPKTKISIGNAIALVTLRLGRLEQLLQDSDGELRVPNSNNNNANTVESSLLALEKQKVLDNVVHRLVLLENMPHSETIGRLTQENKELKSNLQKMLQSFTSFVKETNEKFLDYDAAFVDLENKIKETEPIALDDFTTVLNDPTQPSIDQEHTAEEEPQQPILEQEPPMNIEDNDKAQEQKETILSEKIKSELRNISVVV